MSSASSKRRGRKNSWLQEQWVAYRKSMLESPAFLALSLSGHRVLARVGLEHLRHKGVENGWLPVTYQDFALSNVDKGSISAALAECIALGFLQITKKRPGRQRRLPHVQPLSPDISPNIVPEGGSD
jgi:hypothetical protein